MVTEAEVKKALEQVVDPEIGLNMIELGLIYEVKIEGDAVKVKMSLTSPACPFGPMIIGQSQNVVSKIPGVKKADVEVTFSPPWHPKMMSEEAKAKVGYVDDML